MVAWLCAGVHVDSVAPLSGGVSADTQRVACTRPDGVREVVVVRVHREFAGKAPAAQRAAREFAVLEALHARGMPVPRPRWLVPPATLVVDHVDGHTTLPADAAGPLAEALAAIHRTPLAGLPALDCLTDPVPSLREWLPALAGHPRFGRGCGTLAAPPCLVHGDFWPGNVLWHAGRLAAVLDWEDVMLGDPLIDVACARCELFRIGGTEAAERFTAAYAQRAAVDVGRLRWWDLFMATAPLVTMQGWGLPPDALAARRAACSAWQALALAATGLSDAPVG